MLHDLSVVCASCVRVCAGCERDRRIEIEPRARVTRHSRRIVKIATARVAKTPKAIFAHCRLICFVIPDRYLPAPNEHTSRVRVPSRVTSRLSFSAQEYAASLSRAPWQKT